MLRIGALKLKNRLIMAPMSGITNLPFRRIVKRLGAGLVTTEMISAMGLARQQEKTLKYLKSDPEEQPLSAQIFGSDPRVMAEAARIVVDAGVDLVDINMGCPARKVVKTGAGGALLRSPDRVRDIVSAVRAVCPVPLTVKTRTGWSPDQPVARDIARLVEDCGADAITFHPRFVTQRFSGTADWDIISEVKSQVGIPVIGNGDVCTPLQALDMMQQTGCDGVMIGRAAMGNPWIFREILDLDNGMTPRPPGLVERREIISDHFRLLVDLMGEESAARAMRGLLLWYTKGLPYSSRFRGAFTGIHDLVTMTAAMDDYFSLLKESFGIPILRKDLVASPGFGEEHIGI
ncbi:MAG: tRNA dihydrouridine synthase DusB [Deltaproteobacteria bacterium]|nr:tRNA dihydrouridine synthase DusB [Deltaproteobacteria bacterium]